MRVFSETVNKHRQPRAKGLAPLEERVLSAGRAYRRSGITWRQSHFAQNFPIAHCADGGGYDTVEELFGTLPEERKHGWHIESDVINSVSR